MSTPRRSMLLEPACDGAHVLIWGLAGASAAGSSVETALAEQLAEHELRGSRVPVVTLLSRGREDAEWIEQAVPWLRLRGRRVIVRTRVVLPRSLVSVLAEAHSARPGSVIVELELAHPKPAIQRALLPSSASSSTKGASRTAEPADTVAALLLQAQHLETLELPVVARLAPLLPGIHDQPNGFAPLLRNLVAADLRDVILEVGHLHPKQLRGLIAAQRDLTVAGLLELARAYVVDPMVVLGGVEVPADSVQGVHKLKPRRAQVFAHGLEQVARDHDGGALRLPSCGCRAHCDLAGSSSTSGHDRPYESVMGRDLFASY